MSVGLDIRPPSPHFFSTAGGKRLILILYTNLRYTNKETVEMAERQKPSALPPKERVKALRKFIFEIKVTVGG